MDKKFCWLLGRESYISFISFLDYVKKIGKDSLLYFPYNKIFVKHENKNENEKLFNEIIQVRKNKKPFYKKLDRLKKWEQ